MTRSPQPTSRSNHSATKAERDGVFGKRESCAS